MGYGRTVLLCAALLPMSVAAARGAASTPADTAVPTVLTVTYLEARTAAIGPARALLQRQVARERSAAVSRSASAFHVQVLQEIDRPERWELLEEAGDQGELQAIETAAAPVRSQLQRLLVAPPDQRRNHELPHDSRPFHAALMPDRRGSAPRHALYALVHLDISATQDQSGVVGAIGQLLQAARAARGNLRAEAWQQDAHPNHFALIFVWATRTDHDAFVAGASARRFRDFVAPLLGSPYDERLGRRLR